MGGVSLGPLALSAERAPVLVAIFTLLLVAGALARRFGLGLNLWASSAVITAAITARLGFVVTHADLYREAPLSALAFWQGGFDPLWGAAGFVLASLWSFRGQSELIVPAVVSTIMAAMAWNVGNGLWQGSTLSMPEEVQLSRMDGSPVTQADLQGRPLVLNLWASWCPPCRREMPMMAEIAADNPDIEILFINQGEGPGPIRAYLAREGITIAPLLDHGQSMMQHFQSQGLPATLFIDASGQLQAAHLGEISRAQLRAGMAQLAE